MGRILKCPVCRIRLNSRKLILIHIVRHPPTPVDLLLWPIKTRKRGSNSMALAAKLVPVINENILAVINRVMDLPVVKRLALIHAVATNRNQHICHICGKVYASGRALGRHKAQHTPSQTGRGQSEWRVVVRSMLVHEPQNRPVGPHQCQRCGRVFASGQGLGGHKQHCRRRAAQTPPARVVRDFDLNELPK